MKIAIGSDERTHLTDFVVEELKKRGIELELHGPLAGEPIQWAEVAEKVAERVTDGVCDQGILFCWTGTGVSMAANKVPGIRAALCSDAETARGARKWNDANILAMSLRLTSPIVAKEILDAWFSANVEEEEKPNIERVKSIERKYNDKG
ncbi:MAG TPA: RpiB/LacA/LacB family sugar-phosphate isomerase [Thermodesulfobacteriota bacterium]|nr:RpiB/LacA/LacB family sugar-phosphate isomerase [Thermodesulfobacteriota bacterium]